jgi:hypothetical protein
MSMVGFQNYITYYPNSTNYKLIFSPMTKNGLIVLENNELRARHPDHRTSSAIGTLFVKLSELAALLGHSSYIINNNNSSVSVQA